MSFGYNPILAVSVSRIMGISISFLKLSNRLGTRYTLEISPTKNEGLEINADSQNESLEMGKCINFRSA